MTAEYDELRIRVWKIGTQRYFVLANGPETAGAVITLEKPAEFYLRELNELLDEEFRRREDYAPRAVTSVTPRLQELGRELFETFFPQPIYKCLIDSLKFVTDHSRSLRLRFELDPELVDIPLETLCAPAEDPLGFLALRGHISIVRSLPARSPGRLRLPEPDDPYQLIKILVISASPTGWEPLNIEQEVERLKRHIFQDNQDLTVSFLKEIKSATRNKLMKELESLGDEPCAVLIISHGEYDDEMRQGFVLLERDNHSPDPLPGDVLAGLLAKASGLRFVVLNLCKGAKASRYEPFSGVAQSLIAVGIPVVAALQYDVSYEAAIEFSPALFGGIYQNQWVDEACTDARSMMTGTSEDTTIEGCTPVLFFGGACNYSWLYKVTPINKSGNPPPDQMKETKKIRTRADKRPRRGPLSAPEAIAGARDAKRQGEWPQVLHYAQRGLTGSADNPVLRSLNREAWVESNVTKLCREICEALVHEDKCDRALQIAGQLQGQPKAVVPKVVNLLEAEVQEALRLAEQYEVALQKDKGKNWSEAVRIYEQILDKRPLGYRDSEARLERANKEEQILQWYSAARLAEDEENWAEAIKLYDNILAWRPDAKGAMRGKEHAQEEFKLQTTYNEMIGLEGVKKFRAAEDKTQEILTTRSSGYKDTSERRAYYRGWIAEEEGRWADAVAEYSCVTTHLYPDVLRRSKHAEGRDAEQKGNWSVAVVAYESLPRDFDGVSQRLPYARGCEAEAVENWAAALKAWEPLPDDYEDGNLGRRRAIVHERIYGSGQEAEKQDKWAIAVQSYACLPESYGDVQMRLPYAGGRTAEQGEQWLEAVAAYETIPEWKDVNQRLPYARGREEERQGRWEKAVAAYEVLEPDYSFADARKRLSYCRGLVAFEREDWQGVTTGFEFGELPDDYREGEVGRRRSYARGRKAEAGGNWAGVIEHFIGLDDNFLEADVGKRRCYAKGRLAVGERKWEEVVEGFGPLPDDYQSGEVGSWRHYAKGRLDEVAGDWQNAVANYQRLPESFEDARERLAYVSGREAEPRGTWEEVIAAYHALPDTYRGGEVGKGRAYAAGRIAVPKEDWAEAEKAFEPLGDFRDARQFLCYVNGRAAAKADDWKTASDAFAQLQREWREDVAQWQSYVRGRFCETLGPWGPALEAYQPLPDDFQDVRQRRERLSRLLQAAPWMDALTGASLVRDPVSCWDGVFPYVALEPAGITPDSPQKNIRDASFVLMEKGLMTPEGRLAWDQLRSVSGRLKVDALMFGARHTETLRRLQQMLEPASGPELIQQVREAAPEDEPLVLLLCGRRDGAAAAWERRQRETPDDTQIAHALAIACLCRAKELEEKGVYERAEVTWEQAIANWAYLLTDDAYWLSWLRGRAGCYREMVSESDLAYLRSELGESIAKELARYADRCLMEGRKERAAKYQRLALKFEVELEGARALKEVGGLLIEDNGGARLCCGKLFLHGLNQERALAQLILELEKSLEKGEEEALEVASLEEMLAGAGEPLLPAPTPEVVQRLRCVFSELGPTVVLLERHRYEEAMQALPSDYYRQQLSQPSSDCDLSQSAEPDHLERCDRCQQFKRRNPAYLYLPHRETRLCRDTAQCAVRTHLAIAEAAITSGDGDLDEPLKHWKQAVETSRQAGTQVRTKRAIARVALGRASALERERGAQRGRRLKEAIDLLDAVRKLTGGVDEAQLRGKQSKLLTNLGIWHGSGCLRWEEPDYTKAADDLRQALELNSDSVNARENLARSLIYQSFNIHYLGERTRPLVLLREALEILDQGLRQVANHTRLQAVFQSALKQLEEVLLSGQSTEETLRRLDEVLNNQSDSPDREASGAQELVAQAKQKLESNNASGAALDLIEVLRLRVDDELARRELLNALQRLAG